MSKFRATDDDTDYGTLLPVGYKDPKSPNYVPEGLRQAVADLDPAITAQMRDGILRTVSGSMFRGRHVVNPRDSDRDLGTAVLWQQVDYVANKMRSDAAMLERAAHEARMHTCAACGTVGVPSVDGRGVTGRTLVDGTRVHICERCLPVANAQALDRLCNERTVDGRTRLAGVKTLLGVK